MSPYASQIRALRGQLGLSRAKFGLLLGVDQMTVYQWENGRRPSADNLDALARVATGAGFDWKVAA